MPWKTFNTCSDINMYTVYNIYQKYVNIAFVILCIARQYLEFVQH